MLKNKIIRLLILSCLFTSLFTGCKNTESETDDSSTSSLTKKDIVYITLNSLSLIGIIGLSVGGYLLVYKPQQKISKDLKNQETKLNQWDKDKKRLKEKITELENKINDLGKLIESEYSEIQSRLKKLENFNKRAFSPPSSNPYSSNYNPPENYPKSNIESLSQMQNYQDNLLGNYGNDIYNMNQNSEEIEEMIENQNTNIVEEYNQNPRSFFDNYQNIRVNLTNETASKIFQQYFTGDIEFKEDKKLGEYFIISTNFNECYLFLSNNLSITDSKLRTIRNGRLFDIIGELSSPKIKAENIKINRPAKVEKHGEYWRLIESGEIDLRDIE
ncbi:hypothetical protein ACN4EE_09190 [Geminocystis sp. CENA526]|uniref:hypothetical protein n=1 Tax=Geminocystis sp. CENA526 TaxID=1355871 RepID=UPI003D6EFC76